MTRAHFVTYALDDEGRPISGVTVTVYEPDTTTAISETLYDDDTDATTLSNPFTGDDDGRVEFYLDVPKSVDLKFSKVGFDTTTFRAVAMALNTVDIQLLDDGVGMAQRAGINFQDGFVLADDAVNNETEIDLDWATTEIADIADTEDDGASTKVPRADHAHKHPIFASGDLHSEYLQESTHTKATHDAMGLSHDSLADTSTDDHHAKLHATEHEPGGTDELTLEALAARLAGAQYFIYKSGSTYYAMKLSNSSTLSSDTDAAVVINAAATALTTGGEIWVSSVVFNISTGIVLGANVTLRGGRIVGEGAANGPLITPAVSLGASVPCVKLNGTGAAVTGITVDAGTNASEAVLMNVDATAVRDCYLNGGTVHTLANTTATARQRVAHVRCDGDSHPTTSVVEFWSTDHLVHDIVATGAGTKAAMIVNGNTGQFSVMHVTGNATSQEPLRVLGDQNNFSTLTCDTAGSNAVATLLVKGSRNMFTSLGCMNPATGLSLPAIAIQQPSAGATAYGNQFLGVSLVKGAQNQNFDGVVKFLSSGGSDASSLANFQGTRILFSGTNTDAISGTDLANVMPTPADDIDIIGYISSPTELSVDTRHRWAGLVSHLTTNTNLVNNTEKIFVGSNFTADLDTDGFAGGATAIFTVPTGFAGKWRISGQVSWESNANGRRRADLYLNGVSMAIRLNIPANPTAGEQLCASFGATVRELAEGDDITLGLQQNSGGGLNASATTTWLSFEYIGA